MTDVLIEALAEHNDDLVAALKTIVSAEVRVVLDGSDVVGINLDDTKVTDEAMERLVDLGKLRWIGLVRTDVTPEGIENLRKALPNCTVLV
ncbi:MAG: hypothetical protein QGG55_05410, partial [Verrucomicrobiota bacterium]|jgi:hypothetical protein|nr:hypothetical protein [Verrucomicrobiota bacterium]|tara:strand:- start:184 stop:456 length:273 start_codon:yes stop_codon:yes gene_type:complete